MKCTCSSIVGFFLLLSSVANAVQYVNLKDVNPDDTYVLIPVDHMFGPITGQALRSKDNKPSLTELDPEAAHDVGKDNSLRWKFPKGLPFVRQQTLKSTFEAGVILSVETGQYLGGGKDSYSTNLPDADKDKLAIAKPTKKDENTIWIVSDGVAVQDDWITKGINVASSQWRIVKTTKKYVKD